MAAQEQPSAQAAGSDKLICKSIGEVGSRLAKKRVCRTRQQWAEDKRQSRDVVDRAQRGGLKSCDPNVPC
jgi:hypothetical protein